MNLLADWQLEAIIAGRQSWSVTGPPPVRLSMPDAYALQALFRTRLGPIGAWKAGGTTLSTQRQFGVSGPFFGPIAQNSVVLEKYRVEQVFPADLQVKGEVEIVLGLRCGSYTAKSKRSKFKWEIVSVHLGVEMPWCQFGSSPSVEWLIADQCASGGLLVGPGIPLDRWSKTVGEVSLSANGKLMESVGPSSPLIVSPEKCKAEFDSHRYLPQVNANEKLYLATGGITQCVDLERKVEYSVHSDELPSFKFLLP